MYSADQKSAISLSFDGANQLVPMELWFEGFDLPEQSFGQFPTGAKRNARNIVNRLVRIERNALATRVGQRVHDMGADTLQSELKNLKQPNRTGANDERVGRYGHWH